MKIIVTGSLGNVSKPLTEVLVKNGHDVTVISSTVDRKEAIEALGAKAAIGTLDDVDFLTETFTGADAVYLMSTLGAKSFFDQDVQIVEEMSKLGENYKTAIERSGVKKVVQLSAIGAHKNSGNGNLVFHYNIENILKELPADVSIKVMRPASFLVNLMKSIPNIKEKGIIISNYTGDTKEPWVYPADIAAAIAEEMEKPFNGRSIRYVASDEVSPNEIAETLGKAIGKPELKWTAVPSEQMLAGMISMGMNSEAAQGLVEMQTAQGNGSLYEDYFKNRPLLGKIKLVDFAKEFAEVYQK